MNKSIDQRIEEERKQARRSWQGLLLMLTLVLLSMAVFAFMIWKFGGIQNEWFMVPFMVILIFLTMGGMIYWIEMSRQQEVERSKEVSSRLLPDMPVEEEEVTKKEKNVILAILSLLFLLLFPPLFWLLLKAEDALERVWPDANFEIISMLFCNGLFSIFFIIIWASQKWRPRQEEEGESSEPVQRRRGRFVMAEVWFSTFLMMFLFVGLPWLIKNYDLPRWIGILGFLFSTLFSLLFVSRSSILQWWIWKAVKEGDYEQAFSRLYFVEQFQSKNRKLLTLEGKLLFLAGRYEEGQKLFEKELREEHQLKKTFDSDILNHLGHLLLGQAQYEEATLALEGSIDMKASQVLAYCRLAEVYLHQGTKLKEARKLTERGLQNHDASLLLRWTAKGALIETLAIHAWVLAELGLHHDAAQALERAFRVVPRKNKPLLAALHLRAGYVSLRRGNRQQAKEHFTTGQQLDPRGHYGRLAGVALAEM